MFYDIRSGKQHQYPTCLTLSRINNTSLHAISASDYVALMMKAKFFFPFVICGQAQDGYGPRNVSVDKH